MFSKQKIQWGQSKTAKYSKIQILVNRKSATFIKNFNVLSQENINFSEIYVRHFPREFANSMVNTASVQVYVHNVHRVL